MKQTISSNQKAIIALEAIKEVKENNQLASQYEVHPIKIGLWKKTIIENAHLLFEDKKGKAEKERKELTERLYKIIGQRDIEIEWLKKKFNIDS